VNIFLLAWQTVPDLVWWLFIQKNTQEENLKLQREMAEKMEKHQKELMQQMEKHQMELAEALENLKMERAHRELLEEELASQQHQLANLERVEKELRSAAPQIQRDLEVPCCLYRSASYNTTSVIETSFSVLIRINFPHRLKQTMLVEIYS